MSILRSAVEKRSFAPVEIPLSSGSWSDGMVWNGAATPAVSTDQAMRLSAVYACLRLLSEAVATLPLDTFRRVEGTRESYERPDYLTFAPPQGNRIDYLSQLMLSLLTDGNAYVLTPRDRLGVPVDLVVLDPAKVKVDAPDGRIRYRLGEQTIRPGELMHIKGMCLPGQLRGVSPIAYARETVGLGLAAQSFGSSFFTNGALPGAVIQTPGDMTREAAERFAESWHARHSGVGAANRVGVLTNGATLNKVSIQPNDAQFLETRAFQVPDVARIFGVPPHLIADASNSTSWGSGLAEQNLAFGQFSLRPWIDRIEEAHNRLLMSHGMTEVFVKLNMDALLRASLRDRYESYEVGIRAGFLLEDEARALEDLAPLGERDGGEASMDSLTRQLQQIYLAVGTVISADEAREILNRNGAGLTGPAPTPSQPDAPSAADLDGIRSSVERTESRVAAMQSSSRTPDVHVDVAPPAVNVVVEAPSGNKRVIRDEHGNIEAIEET